MTSLRKMLLSFFLIFQMQKSKNSLIVALFDGASYLHSTAESLLLHIDLKLEKNHKSAATFMDVLSVY